MQKREELGHDTDQPPVVVSFWGGIEAKHHLCHAYAVSSPLTHIHSTTSLSSPPLSTHSARHSESTETYRFYGMCLCYTEDASSSLPPTSYDVKFRDRRRASASASHELPNALDASVNDDLACGNLLRIFTHACLSCSAFLFHAFDKDKTNVPPSPLPVTPLPSTGASRTHSA
ncbi:hypothetical protein R3P38DRAFT_3201669 [Favolaschia claudopus]|uniref:Uncharacterized protein n=1 Tax=Favolaschia claudopus TaxID=2862362 RepID=A0AAW0AYC5_9AGAR